MDINDTQAILDHFDALFAMQDVDTRGIDGNAKRAQIRNITPRSISRLPQPRLSTKGQPAASP